MLKGILWVLYLGAAWRDMPERFGPWSTVYPSFVTGEIQTSDQVLKRLHVRLSEKRLIDVQTWMTDSTAGQRHQAASGAEASTATTTACSQ